MNAMFNHDVMDKQSRNGIVRIQQAHGITVGHLPMKSGSESGQACGSSSEEGYMRTLGLPVRAQEDTHMRRLTLGNGKTWRMESGEKQTTNPTI